MSFLLGEALLGFGEGGAAVRPAGAVAACATARARERRAGEYRLATHRHTGAVQWLIGTRTAGGCSIHQPYGAFEPDRRRRGGSRRRENALPLDIFVVASSNPLAVMREYAGITAFPSCGAR